MTKHKLKALIFDMDGLMFDSEEFTYQFLKEQFEKVNKNISREFYCTICGHSVSEAFQIIHKKYGYDCPYEEFLIKAIEYRSSVPLPIKPGLIELLDYAVDNNLLLSIASGSPLITIERCLANGNLSRYFQTITSGDDVTHSKPDPEIYLKSLQKLGLLANECLVLEDASSGIMASHMAGIPVIAVPDMTVPKQDILQLATGVFANLYDVIPYIQQLL